jgi:hypothetical protein
VIPTVYLNDQPQRRNAEVSDVPAQHESSAKSARSARSADEKSPLWGSSRARWHEQHCRRNPTPSREPRKDAQSRASDSVSAPRCTAARPARTADRWE